MQWQNAKWSTKRVTIESIQFRLSKLYKGVGFVLIAANFNAILIALRQRYVTIIIIIIIIDTCGIYVVVLKMCLLFMLNDRLIRSSVLV